MNNLIEIKNLNLEITNEDNTVNILKKVNLKIKKAQTVALVGQSGSGKSMLAHTILNLLPRGAAFKVEGEINFDFENILSYDDNKMRKIRGAKISMIFQEPMTALNPLHKINKQIAEIIYTHNLISQKEIDQKVEDLLIKVELHTYGNLEKIKNSYPHELSGGQRQRVMIAIAIANEPDLLIADEPTTALDLTIQHQILQLLVKLQDEYKMSILLITHDLKVVKKYSDYIYVINEGKILESQKCQDLFLNPINEYTKMLLESTLNKNDLLIKNKKQILNLNNLSVNFPITKGIFKRVVDNFQAVKDVNIKIYQGESYGIIGESGSGKSTLAQAILCLQDSIGEVWFFNEDIKNISKNEMRLLRKKMQIVFQDPFNSLNPRLSIYEIISEGLDIHTSLSFEEKEKKVKDILKEVSMSDDCLNKYPHEFSGGQRQRIAVARALILEPKLLILDEPTSALDRQVQFQLLELLKSIQKKYDLTYIFISHDLEVIQNICNRVCVMKQGQIIEENYTQELFTNPCEDYTKELIKASF